MSGGGVFVKWLVRFELDARLTADRVLEPGSSDAVLVELMKPFRNENKSLLLTNKKKQLVGYGTNNKVSFVFC